jgi:hypothetical protein
VGAGLLKREALGVAPLELLDIQFRRIVDHKAVGAEDALKIPDPARQGGAEGPISDHQRLYDAQQLKQMLGRRGAILGRREGEGIAGPIAIQRQIPQQIATFLQRSGSCGSAHSALQRFSGSIVVLDVHAAAPYTDA